MHFTTSAQDDMNLGFGHYTCNRGTHIACLYETSAERGAIMLGFMHQGALDGDLQLYGAAERRSEEFMASCQRACPAYAGHAHDSGCFQVRTAKELYYPERMFSPRRMDQSLAAFYEASQQAGRRHVRAAAEMVGALEAIPGAGHLMADESRLNYVIPGKPWMSLCLYDLPRFPGAMIMQVLQTPPFTISGNVITANACYQDPDAWLNANAPAFQARQERA